MRLITVVYATSLAIPSGAVTAYPSYSGELSVSDSIMEELISGTAALTWLDDDNVARATALAITRNVEVLVADRAQAAAVEAAASAAAAEAAAAVILPAAVTPQDPA